MRLNPSLARANAGRASGDRGLRTSGPISALCGRPPIDVSQSGHQKSPSRPRSPVIGQTMREGCSWEGGAASAAIEGRKVAPAYGLALKSWSSRSDSHESANPPSLAQRQESLRPAASDVRYCTLRVLITKLYHRHACSETPAPLSSTKTPGPLNYAFRDVQCPHLRKKMAHAPRRSPKYCGPRPPVAK